MTTTASLVLRGKNGLVLRLEDQAVVLRSAAEERLIPLAAIAGVRAEWRTVEVELLGGDEPVVYRVQGVTEAGADAFTQAVRRLLPERDGDVVPVDGVSLVEVRPLAGRANGWFSERKAVTAAGALLYLGLLVTVGVVGGWAQAGSLVFGSLLLPVGGFLVFVSVRAILRERRLTRHGITVMAEFSHYTNKWRVYSYTTATGAKYTYQTTGVNADRIEVTYDPATPGVATQPGSFLGTTVGMLIVVLMGASMVTVGLSLIGQMIAEVSGG
ncbi:hypothetical protein ABZ923_10585 [Streptomyces sp. NPDC046881]|uniref:hypothetical protein n=1 Tax=Streptomyces sp. NPDC046881 TaxID=3155374 RepID=UPI0033CA85E0